MGHGQTMIHDRNAAIFDLDACNGQVQIFCFVELVCSKLAVCYPHVADIRCPGVKLGP